VAARERCLRVLTQESVSINGNHVNGKSGETGQSNGISTGVDGARVKATQVVIPDDLRASSTPKMVMYGSTQTHSIGKKVGFQVSGLNDMGN
jgi:hypothetical protein